MELLNRSAISLHATLSSAWGTLYVQNAQVFSDLYADLRRYYRGSNVNLEEVLNEFWVRLLEKLLHPTNKQSLAGTTHILPSTWLQLANMWTHDIMQSECPFSEQMYVAAGEDYLECVSKQMETLRPFGDFPRAMKVSVTRAVLAARSFVQGLAVSGEVVRKVSQVNPHILPLLLLLAVIFQEFSFRSSKRDPRDEYPAFCPY